MGLEAGAEGVSRARNIRRILFEEDIIVAVARERRLGVPFPCIILDHKLIFIKSGVVNGVDDGLAGCLHHKVVVVLIGVLLLWGDPHCVGSCVDVTMLNFNGCS